VSGGGYKVVGTPQSSTPPCAPNCQPDNPQPGPTTTPTPTNTSPTAPPVMPHPGSGDQGPIGNPNPNPNPHPTPDPSPLPAASQRPGAVTTGICEAFELGLIAGEAVGYCYVEDSYGNTASLRVTIHAGDEAGLVAGASLMAGPMFSDGSIADQEGAFTFVSFSAGFWVGAGVTQSSGHGSQCDCTVTTTWGGGGIVTPGITIVVGVSNTEIDWHRRVN
jgi:hypothetical protein